jgi:hypothetical protein
MKKYYLYAFAIILAMSACNQTNVETKNSVDSKNNLGLFISTLTAKSVNDSLSRTEQLSEIKLEYFEVKLVKQIDDFIATKDIENSKNGNNIKLVSISIVDRNGKLMHFKSSIEFLNYMSDRGYDVFNQVQEKESVNYTFKKR